jgi:hypothetical protein
VKPPGTEHRLEAETRGLVLRERKKAEARTIRVGYQVAAEVERDESRSV